MRARPAIAAVFLILAGAVAPQATIARAATPDAAPLADDEILVVDEKDLDRMWRPASKRRTDLDARSPKARRLDAGCVAVGYVIETDGRVRTAQVLRSHPAGVLDDDGLRTARRMRFVPGPENPARAPVYSVISWSRSQATVDDVTAAMRPCLLDIEVPQAAASR